MTIPYTNTHQTTIIAKKILINHFTLNQVCGSGKNEPDNKSSKSDVSSPFDNDINCCHLFSMASNKWEQLTATSIIIINKLMVKLRFQNRVKSTTNYRSTKKTNKILKIKQNQSNNPSKAKRKCKQICSWVGKISTIEEIRRKKLFAGINMFDELVCDRLSVNNPYIPELKRWLW